MRYLLLGILLIFLNGCFNKNGVSKEYYDDCHIEYDMYGVYKTTCPHNFYNYKKGVVKKDCLQCN